MADFTLKKRKSQKAGEQKAPKEQLTPDESASLLRKAGGAAMGGLHTVGSLASTVSRGLWGSANAASGHEAGLGNLNPIDSTGGIELSGFLANQGLIPHNDPHKWEWSDLGRGALDIAGDPLTYTGVGLLTRGGQALKQLGKLSPGILNQVRRGERGLVGLQLPFSRHSYGAVGTGAKVADSLEAAGNATGAFKLAKKVGESAPVRHWNAMMDARYAGKLDKAIQKYVPESHEALRQGQRGVHHDTYALATKIKNAGLHTPEHDAIFRDVLEGVHNPLATPAHHQYAGEMKAIGDKILERDMGLGVRTGELAGDDVHHFFRRMSEGIDPNVQHGFEMAANRVHGRDEVWKQLGGTNAIQRMLKDPAIDAMAKANAHLPMKDQLRQLTDALRQSYGKHYVDPLTGAQSILNDKMANGKSRFRSIAGKMLEHEKLRTEGLFGNSPLHDLHTATTAANARFHGADLAFNAIADTIHSGTHGTSVKKFLKATGFEPDIAAQHIAGRTGKTVQDVLDSRIPDDLAKQLQSLTPGYRVPPAEKGISDTLKSLQTIWKSSVLAFPASRVRDAVSGAIQNVLLGHGGGYGEARNIAHGAKLARDYSHLPEVADLMKRHGLTHDDAVKVILATEAPRSSGFVSDISPGQIGATTGDILNQIPGHEKSGFRKVMARAGRSFIKGELDAAGNPIAEGRVYNPANVAGAFGRESTAFGPAAASNVVSGASDEFNRHSGLLGQMRHGYNPSVAGEATRAAQVDYDPQTYSAFEKNVLKQAMPFYGFTSRMGAHTAKELATHPGGLTGQLVKAEDHSHAQDPAIPDRVLAGTALPLGEMEDGTRRFITGAGLMHEPAVNMLGAALGGNLRGAGYDVLGMLNPLARVPMEATVGKSFFQRGEPTENLRPNVGQILSDVGVRAGLRDKDSGPVEYPGSTAVEMALGVSPFGRLASTARSLTDLRKEPLEKALNTLSGIRVEHVSPQKQTSTLLRRAQDLARSEGARTREDVYFNKAERERLKESNPAMYERQMALQQMLNKIRAKSSSGSASSKSKKAKKEPAPKISLRKKAKAKSKSESTLRK